MGQASLPFQNHALHANTYSMKARMENQMETGTVRGTASLWCGSQLAIEEFTKLLLAERQTRV